MKFFILTLLISFSTMATEGVFPLTYGEENLYHLDKMVKGAEVLAIGESGHGSKGYLETRTQLIKHFVKESGFRVIILEEGYLKSEALNEYLNSCSQNSHRTSDLRALVEKLNSIYANEEMLQTMDWLCSFNTQNPENPVSFHGMDIWETPWTDREVIRSVAQKAAHPELSGLFESAFQNCWGWKANSWEEAETFEEWQYLLRTWRIEPQRNFDCMGALINLRRLFASERAILIERTSENEVFLAEIAVQVQEVYQLYRDLAMWDFKKVLSVRDTAQATFTIAHHSRHPNSKAILLAHNIHVSKKQSAVILRNPNRDHWVDVRSTGELLRGHYGRGYKSIGLTGYKVSSSRDGDYPLPVASDSLDLTLASMGEKLLVDPRANWITDLGEWWMHLEGDINGSFHVPHEQYDAIIFLKESGKATNLHTQKLL